MRFSGPRSAVLLVDAIRPSHSAHAGRPLPSAHHPGCGSRRLRTRSAAAIGDVAMSSLSDERRPSGRRPDLVPQREVRSTTVLTEFPRSRAPQTAATSCPARRRSAAPRILVATNDKASLPAACAPMRVSPCRRRRARRRQSIATDAGSRTSSSSAPDRDAGREVDGSCDSRDRFRSAPGRVARRPADRPTIRGRPRCRPDVPGCARSIVASAVQETLPDRGRRPGLPLLRRPRGGGDRQPLIAATGCRASRDLTSDASRRQCRDVASATLGCTRRCGLLPSSV